MSIETKLFFSGMLVFIPVGAIYAFFTGGEAVGTTGLFLTGGLAAMVGGYLWLTARRIDPRPEDDPQAHISEAAGDQGFFSPWSWWPLPLALAAFTVFFGLAVSFWVCYIGAALGVVSLVGLLYEHYRGRFAH
ncbi:cytochrome c oxidase subunit 4 [Pseudokineococcus basanitobsidens]|uniref:Cytochrome c oxidase polypeptide 4 n=1 Tax=Pseudokineococcus basanitobsidens TaxID=1926649 RepID=A0ABU8RJC0_9ACTN